MGHQQLFPLCIDVAFLREFAKGVEDSALASVRVVVGVAQVLCDGVGSLEADAPDVIGQAIGIVTDFFNALLAVFFKDLGSESGTDAMPLEKYHDVLRYK